MHIFTPAVDTLGFFQSIFAKSRLYAVLITDVYGNILACNETFQYEFGYAEESLLGKKFSSLFVSEDKIKGLPGRELQTAKQAGAAMDKNYLLHADGHPLWVLGETIEVSNTKDEHFLVKTVVNVNNEKLLEERLLASNDLLEKMMQTVSDALLVVNEQENILKVNKAFTSLFETEDYIFEGTQVSALPVQFWQLDEIRETIRSIFKERQLPKQKSFSIRRKNGKQKIISFEGFLLEGYLFATPTLLVILKDETQKRLLERRNKDIMAFFAHEIKNPMTRLGLSVQLIKDGIKHGQTDFLNQYIDILEATVGQLNGLVRDLADSAIASLNRLSIDIAPVEYTALIQDCISGLELTFPGVRTVFQADKPVVINADKHRIAQVIENLLSNAVKYAGKDKIIEISLELAAGVITTSVTDYGPGIDENSLPYIFKRLFRAEQQKGSGLGLGLYLCKSIIRAHGGEIAAENIPGKGARFYFTLPLPSKQNEKGAAF